MITRLRLDARLFDPPPRRTPRTVGRPPVIGRRQPTLAERLANPRTRWHRLLVTGWYGRGERHVQVVSGTALWHHPGRLGPIRYVLVRDVAGELKPQAFLCTDVDADPIDILRWFIRRWSIEPLVYRSDFRRGPPPSRRRNSAAMVRPGHQPDHPELTWALLTRHIVGSQPVCQDRAGAAHRALVCKAASDFLATHSPPSAGHCGRPTISARRRQGQTSPKCPSAE